MLNCRAIIGAALVSIAMVGISQAQACSNIDVNSRGYAQNVEITNRGCNDTQVRQRGHNNGADVSTSGYGHETTVSQIGSNQRARINVEGVGNQTHVFTGICPAGSRQWDVNVGGVDRLGVIVLPCR